MIALKLVSIDDVPAWRWNRLRVELEDRLHQVVSDPRTETPAGPTERGLGNFEVRPTNDDVLQANGVSAHDYGFLAAPAGTFTTAIRNENSCWTNCFTTLAPILAGLKRMNGSASRTASAKSSAV